MYSESAYDLSNIVVAIIDDNPHMLKLAATMARGLKVRRVLSYGNGREALANQITDRADILLLDWLVEPISYADFLREARDREKSANPFIPIIVMKGFTAHTDVAEARDLGATEFIALPMAPRTLYERIVHVIDHPRPFIDAPTYFGPDRRRRDETPLNGEERRQAPPTLIDTDAQEAGQELKIGGSASEADADSDPPADDQPAEDTDTNSDDSKLRETG